MRSPILVERGAADLHLHDGVAAIEVAAHLGAQRRQVLARIVVAPGGIHEDPRIRLDAVPLGQQPEERLAGNLGDRIPDSHVDGADRDRALAVSSRLLVLHHRPPHAIGVEVVARVVEQRLRIGIEQPRQEAFADEAALTVAPVGIEAVPDHAAAVAHDVGDDRDEAHGHLA